MQIKLEKFYLILSGIIIGILLSANLPVFADKKEQNKLPINELRSFAEVFGKIKSDYIEPIEDKQLIDDALKGMLAGLDPHSTFLDKDRFKELTQGTKGEFGGLGIEVGMEDGFVKIISPIEDTPAYKAGLLSGDLIIKLDNTQIKGLTLDEAVRLMRGKPGTSIILKVLRKNQEYPFNVKITRAQIKTKSVKAKLIEPNYAYFRITQFQERTGEDLATAIKKIRAKNKHALNGIILDMRNNPGGLLNSAVAVSATFLKEGDLVVYTKGRAVDSKMHLTAIPENFIKTNSNNNYLKNIPSDIKDTPLVVLVNNGSASASEIVAGALQDHKRAIIVGTRSFGKGSVQSILPMLNGTAIKLTTARYFTPNGRSIQAKGIIPDVVIKNGSEGSAYREEDIPNRLSNPTEKKEEKNKQNKTTVDQSPKENSEMHKNFKPVELGGKDDKQYIEALNILKNIGSYSQN